MHSCIQGQSCVYIIRLTHTEMLWRWFPSSLTDERYHPQTLTAGSATNAVAVGVFFYFIVRVNSVNTRMSIPMIQPRLLTSVAIFLTLFLSFPFASSPLALKQKKALFHQSPLKADSWLSHLSQHVCLYTFICTCVCVCV